MALFESHEGLAALDEVGAAFEQAGRSLRRVVALAKRAQRTERAGGTDLSGIPQHVEVAQLMGRLGSANQKLLVEVALNFDPTDTFTIEDMAELLKTTKESIRARLMNIGRSMRALGPLAPDLWSSDWDSEEGANVYQWDYDAHRALMRMIEG
jgi:hypothetical protein